MPKIRLGNDGYFHAEPQDADLCTPEDLQELMSRQAERDRQDNTMATSRQDALETHYNEFQKELTKYVNMKFAYLEGEIALIQHEVENLVQRLKQETPHNG